MGRRFCSADFDNYETWVTLSTTVAHGLYEAADVEFSTIIGGADVGAGEIRDIRESAEVMKAFVCAYIDGLAELYCGFGCKFSGDQSAKDELYAKLGTDGNQLWKRGAKHGANTLREFFKKRFISDNR